MAGTAEVPVTNPTTGEIRMVPREGVKAFTDQTGWHVSTADQREVAAENLESGSTGQQALAAGEQVVRTGTLGLAPGMEGWQQREKVLRRESPVVSGLAQGAGAVLPAVITGGLAGGVAGAVGLGARGAALAGAVGEGFAGGLADEVEQARYETRDVSLGNVMMYGVGGELVGRALPHAFSMGAGKIKRALTGAEAAAGEGLTDALVTAEERAGRSQADLAHELPKGSPERLEALRSTAPEQYDRMSKAAATDLDQIADLSSQMGDTSKSPKVVSRLRETLADESPAQTDFFTGVKRNLDDAKKTLRAVEETRGSASPVSLAGKTNADLGIIDDVYREGSLTNLRGSEEFTRTGRVPRAVDRESYEKGITVIQDGPGEIKLRDGTHRLKVAQEKDMPSLWGTVIDGETGKVVYQGDIPLKAASKGASLADAPGMKPFATRFDQIVDSAQKKLDRTTDAADSFLISRDAKRQLEQLSAEMSRKAPGEAGDAFRAVIDDAHSSISAGLKDRSLFGGAADIEAELSGPWSEKVSRGLGTTEADLARKEVDPKTGRTLTEFDPKKIRSFLKGDAIDRQLSQGKLEQVLEGAEEMAAAHERHGTWNTEQIKNLRDAVGRVREKLSLADELQAATGALQEKTTPGGRAEKSLGEQAARAVKGYAVGRAAGAAGAAAGGLIGGPVGAALGWGVGEIAQSVGQRLLGLDAAARNATKQAARNLAGVGLGYAERVAGNVSKGAAGAALAGGAMTALARFQGDYPDAQASFDAKRKVLDQHQLQPEVLYETLANSLGDLPKVRPDLFQAIAQRTGEKVRFIRENLPAGLQTSLLYPNGTPPSTSDLRDFATLWNTVLDPETVVHDLNAGTATQQQMAILKKSDRELYDQLRGDIIEMVGTHFKDVPTSTKASLDLLLGADGLAGPLYSSAAARYIGDATKMAQAQGQRPLPPPNTKAPAGMAPAGINAIQTSVTNRQAA